MQRLVLLTFVLVMANLANAETHISGGNISGVWELAGSPFFIEGNCVITSTSTLTIEPGVEVFMEPLVRIRCEGQLLAVGTETDSILITATDTIQGCEGLDFLNTDLSPMDSSKLVYCIIKHGVASPWPDGYMHGGGLYLKNSSRVLICNCLIRNCLTQNVVGASGLNGSTPGADGQPGESGTSGHGGGIYCENCSPLIMFCHICNNETGDVTGGHGGDGAGNGSGYYSVFGGDGGAGGTAESGSGGGICLVSSQAVLFGNVISGNVLGHANGGNGGTGAGAVAWDEWWHAYGGDGGIGGAAASGIGAGIALYNSNPQILNNLIYNNCLGSGDGGNGGNGGAAMAAGGLAYAHPGDGGVGGDGSGGQGYAVGADITSNVTLSNGTVADHLNQSTGVGGAGGLDGSGLGYAPNGVGNDGEYIIAADNLVQMNSIVWNSVDPSVTPGNTILYSCVEGGYPGAGNISADPLFASRPQGDYYLSQTAAGQPQESPCVDAGDPNAPLLTGTTRTDLVPDAGIIDMGYHYLSSLSSPILIVTPDSLYFYAELGTTNPDDQIITVGNGGIGSFSFNVTETVDWLTVSPMSGGPVPPTCTLVASVDTAGLTMGTYEAEITITAEGALGSPFVIPVTFKVDQFGILYGPLSGTLIPHTYEVVDNIYVPEGEELVIEPGTTILFDGLYSFDIYGELRAVGTVTDSIIFLCDEGIPGWQGIKFFDQASDSSCFQYCRISESDSTGLHITNCSPAISNCRISDNSGYNGGGMYFNYAPVSLYDCMVCDNTAFAGGGIYAINSDGWSISSSEITNNNATTVGGGMNIRGGDCTIEYCYIAGNFAQDGGAGINSGFYNCTYVQNCEIINNTSMGGGGGLAIVQYQEFYISQCDITQNSAVDGGGVVISYGPYLGVGTGMWDCQIRNNHASETGGGIFVHNVSYLFDFYHNAISENSAGSYGGGIYIYGSSRPSPILHCTIANNTAGIEGGGLYIDDFWNEWDDFLINSIIKDNTNYGLSLNNISDIGAIMYSDFHNNLPLDIIGVQFPGFGELTTTNYNGDSCDVYYNIFLDPLFVDPAGGNFHLQWPSPCVDAGDPASPLDPDSTIADIGAFYFDQSVPVIITVTPYNPPIQIPATGGSFDFNISLTNIAASSTTFDAWIMTQLPNGSWYGPLLGPVNLTLAAGIGIDRDRMQSVPGGAPEGVYVYEGRVGAYPDDIWATDQFDFEKLSSGDGSPVEDWLNTGESFDQWLALPAQPQMPDHFALYPAFPNPFNPAATIRYALPQAAKVNLTIYNISGRSVTRLLDGWRDAGYHEVTFDGSDLASGVYLYRLMAGEYAATGKMLLVK